MAKKDKTIGRHVVAFGPQLRNVQLEGASLAPRFVRAFREWQANTNGSLPDFVRTFDPTVPRHACKVNGHEGYRGHPTYRAAAYLFDYARVMQSASRRADGV